MTSKQRQQWEELCLRAVKEPDPGKQMAIVAELNRLLDRPKKPVRPFTRAEKRGA